VVIAIATRTAVVVIPGFLSGTLFAIGRLVVDRLRVRAREGQGEHRKRCPRERHGSTKHVTVVPRRVMLRSNCELDMSAEVITV
jgi:hypothetical protein